MQKVSAKPVLESYEFVKSRFEKDKKVFYSRFGDGDLFIMMGKNQQDQDYDASLQQELIESFEINEENYLRGLAINYPVEKGMMFGLFLPFEANDLMLDYILKNLKNLDDKFESALFLHYFAVFRQDLVIDFLNTAIRPKRKMFIGSIEKEKVENLIGEIHYYVTVPSRNSYQSMDTWWPEVLKNIHDVELVIPAAGVAGRVINKRLWKMGVQVQAFDIGSLVDASEVRGTRRWLRLAGHRINKILIKNENSHKLGHKISYLLKELKFRFKLLKGK